MLQPAFSVILASSSPQRRELLSRLIEDFEIVAPGIDEDVSTDDPHELVRELALQKADAVVARVDRPAIIIAADTIAWCRGEIIGKPADTEDAVRALLRLSHNPHSVITGICVAAPGRRWLDAVETKVVMRPMSREEAEDCANFGNALDKAGAYALQEQADRFVERLDGSFTNVIGLPMEWLAEVLISIPGTIKV